MNTRGYWLIIVMLVLCASPMRSLGSEPSDLGTLVETIQKPADKCELKHYKQETTRYRTAQEAATRCDVGLWKTETHTLLLQPTDERAPETIWRRQAGYLVEEARHDLWGITICDTRLYSSSVVVLFTDERAIIIDQWARTADGSWRSTSYKPIPLGQIPSLDRVVVKAHILADQVVQIEYKNGDIEKWSYANKVPRVIWTNELKVKYEIPESIYE